MLASVHLPQNVAPVKENYSLYITCYKLGLRQNLSIAHKLLFTKINKFGRPAGSIDVNEHVARNVPSTEPSTVNF